MSFQKNMDIICNCGAKQFRLCSIKSSGQQFVSDSWILMRCECKNVIVRDVSKKKRKFLA